MRLVLSKGAENRMLEAGVSLIADAYVAPCGEGEAEFSIALRSTARHDHFSEDELLPYLLLAA